MARTRKTSNILAKAQVRLSNLKSISPTLDLGPGLTAADFEEQINETATALDEYNQALAVADEKANKLAASEKKTRDMSARMLAGVGVRHGKNSNEYEKAGGIRTDEIKRPTRKGGTGSGKQG